MPCSRNARLGAANKRKRGPRQRASVRRSRRRAAPELARQLLPPGDRPRPRTPPVARDRCSRIAGPRIVAMRPSPPHSVSANRTVPLAPAMLGWGATCCSARFPIANDQPGTPVVSCHLDHGVSSSVLLSVSRLADQATPLVPGPRPDRPGRGGFALSFIDAWVLQSYIRSRGRLYPALLRTFLCPTVLGACRALLRDQLLLQVEERPTARTARSHHKRSTAP